MNHDASVKIFQFEPIRTNILAAGLLTFQPLFPTTIELPELRFSIFIQQFLKTCDLFLREVHSFFRKFLPDQTRQLMGI